MSVINVTTEEQFNQLLSLGKKSVVLFSAEWAEQCQQVLDVLNRLIIDQSKYKDFQFLNVHAENCSEISIANEVSAVPTVIFFDNKKPIDRIDGVDIGALTNKCNKLAGAAAEDSLDERLKNLINKSKIMIFMKGDRNSPRCGFSKQLIAIMNETGVQYETFDILTNEEVRQGLKTYSDWPTYPQVYVKGELIGGLDIIKELEKTNELTSIFSE